MTPMSKLLTRPGSTQGVRKPEDAAELTAWWFCSGDILSAGRDSAAHSEQK